MKQFAVAFNILYIPKMSDLVTKSFPCPFELFRLFVLCVTRQNQIKFQIDIIQTVQYLKKHGRISVKLPPLVPDNNGAFVILTRIGLFIKHSQVQAGRNDDALFPYLDRKSTRLNSSHVAISYAVFCLKKKMI